MWRSPGSAAAERMKRGRRAGKFSFPENSSGLEPWDAGAGGPFCNRGSLFLKWRCADPAGCYSCSRREFRRSRQGRGSNTTGGMVRSRRKLHVHSVLVFFLVSAFQARPALSSPGISGYSPCLTCRSRPLFPAAPLSRKLVEGRSCVEPTSACSTAVG